MNEWMGQCVDEDCLINGRGGSLVDGELVNAGRRKVEEVWRAVCWEERARIASKMGETIRVRLCRW